MCVWITKDFFLSQLLARGLIVCEGGREVGLSFLVCRNEIIGVLI